MATAEQSQPSELGLAEAADRFAALMDAPAAQPDPAKKKEANAEVEETEAPADTVDETTSEDEEAPDEGSSEEEETEDVGATDDEQEELSDDTLVTVKIDGKTQQIPLKEAIAGYQRNADYSKKTAALAEERRTVEAEKQEVGVARTYYGQRLAELEAQLVQFVPQEPNWEELHREDPINYPIIRDQWRDYKERLAQTQAERARYEQELRSEEQRRLKLIVDEGLKYIREKNPEWRDEAAWNKAKAQLREYGQKAGYSQEELTMALDPRALLVLDKARKYDELMANRPKPQKQQGPKPIKSGNAASSPQRSTDVNRMRQRLKSSGHVNDAAALFGLIDSRRR
jgi:hypothetical protein